MQNETESQEPQNPLLSWSAPEYIYHKKEPIWYSGFVIVSAIVGCLLWLTIRDIWSLIVLVIMMVAVIVFSLRRPRRLQYSLFENGLDIDGRFFPIDQFRAFAEIEEHGLRGIMLMPIGRVTPNITVYTKDGADQIVSFFEERLAKEAYSPDLVDRFMNYIRF